VLCRHLGQQDDGEIRRCNSEPVVVVVAAAVHTLAGGS
jgi:hypothetical protein